MTIEPILVPFGPTRRVPKEHQWCFNCNGEGRNFNPKTGRKRKCPVCGGKGHWNNEDIRAYHKQHPALCKASCGPKHVDHDFTSDPKETTRKLKRAIEKAEDLLKKYGK